MISLRVPGLKSWFDPRSVPALSFELCTKLRTRMANKRGLFITLTYDRNDYESPLDLFYAQQERQDVPMFIRRLQKYLDKSLSGLWMRKMEFQANGWVHFINRRIPDKWPNYLHGNYEIDTITGDIQNLFSPTKK
jgi:hypothetical protein